MCRQVRTGTDLRILLDTDSFLCMRKWSFLNLIVACRSVEIVMTEYAARYELSRIHDEVKKLEVSARLVVERVLARTPAHECYRLLLKAGADKGEAEAMSWAAAQDKKSRPVFISIDKQARGRAKGLGLRAYDLMDFAVICVSAGFLDRQVVRSALSVWDDKKQQFGRPADYTTFDETWRKRSSALKQRNVVISPASHANANDKGKKK
jgi:predicted nucleic acid-binding protein